LRLVSLTGELTPRAYGAAVLLMPFREQVSGVVARKSQPPTRRTTYALVRSFSCARSLLSQTETTGDCRDALSDARPGIWVMLRRKEYAVVLYTSTVVVVPPSSQRCRACERLWGSRSRSATTP